MCINGNWRVIISFDDDGAFGYTAPPSETVIADGLTRNAAKHIYRHYEKKYWYDEWVTVRIEVMFDGGWQDVTQTWIYEEVGNQEEWFDRMGFDYMWWLEFGKIKKL